MTRCVVLIGLAGVLVCAAGCGGSPTGQTAVRSSAAPRPTYGYAPVQNPALRLQPDVRIVAGGSSAIRAVSAGGLTWRMDRNAPGVSDLQVGQIMFATSRAIGRVVRLEPAGGDVSVTLAPVLLTELVRDATIDLTQEIPLDSLTFEDEPDLPAMAGTRPPVADARPYEPVYRPAVMRRDDMPARFVRVSSQAGPMPSTKASGKVTVGNYEVELYGKSDQKGAQFTDKVGIKVQRVVGRYDSDGGKFATADRVKLGLDLGLLARQLTVKAAVSIKDGRASPPTFVVHGLEELHIGLWTGVDDAIENTKVRIDVPIKRTIEFPPGPETGYIPLVFEIKFKFLVEVGVGAKHTSLEAKGRYQLSGPIGVDHGKVVAPAVTPREPIIGSISGISTGVTGVVVAFEVRILTGVGTSAAMAGPYTKFVAAVGITRGSALAAPAPMCKSATLKVDVGAGLGFQFSKTVGGALEKLIGKTIRFEGEMPEIVTTPYNKTFVSPDVPACYH
jgi:hypothetical protein